jgi:PAS domain S-box-containing protein
MNGGTGKTNNGSNHSQTLYQNLRKSGKLQYILVILVFIVLIASALFFIINVNRVVTETAISSYQTNELEIVRETARAIQEYTYVQTVVLGRTDISNVEQEVYTKFVDPIRLLKNGDAWIYAPDHIVFDQSADLPKEYWGKSMAEIFALQKQNGASHYEEMTADVTNAREGIGYYVWLPEKGPEIAAWTPVKVSNYTWTIGLSTPLSEILDATGASAHIALFTYIILASIVIALILLSIWIVTDMRRRRVEEALVESEGLYKTLAESSPDMIYLIDREGIIRYASLRAAQVFGRTPADLIGKRIDAIFPPEVVQHHMTHITGVLTSGQFRQLEVVEPYPDGDHWISVRLSPVKDSEGNVSGVLGISTDITERKRAEEALVESETRYRSLAEASPDHIFIIGRDDTIQYVNSSAVKLLHRSYDQVVGKPRKDLFPPEIAKTQEATLRKVFETGDYIRREEIVPFGKKELWIDTNLVPLKDEAGNVTSVLGIARDSTDRKRAEEALVESEEKYRRLFEQAGDCILILEAEGENRGKIIAANSAAAQMHGYSIDEMLTKNITDLDSPKSRTAVPDRFRQIFSNQRLIGEAIHVRKDGTEFPIDINAGLVTLGTKKYILAIDRDISVRKQQEKALKIANQKLQLMNIVAWHDIQNKITGLRGYVELSQDIIDNEKVKGYLKREEDILQLIDRQIQYTKEYQQIGVQASQWVNIPQTIKNVLMYKTLGPINALVDLSGLEIYCDPIIERVFSHLIDNTLQHGQTATEIRINCHEKAEGLTLVYEDNGIGIPVHKKSNLFTQDVAKFSGFSMFFIHDLLEISEMSIQETGEPGKGARFEIIVPKGMYRFSGTGKK